MATSKKVNRKYQPNDMQMAIKDILETKLSVREASRKYNVPFSTLWSKYNGKYPIEARPGPATILTTEEEQLLVQWILHLSATGFCIDKEQLLNSVQKLVRDGKKETPFTDDRPSKHWYNAFLNRHPEICLRMAQNITARRAELSEEVLRGWFKEIETYLASKNLLDIAGSRIFNCDESAFLLNPQPKKVLAAKSETTAYRRITTDEKECLTVLITGNADGQLAPPMILYAYERIPGSIATAAPPGWSLGHSKTGWMTQESFYEYITSNFYQWCLDTNIEFPIILYVDGHLSHLTMALSDFCVNHQIELIALYPNATHMLQPMDVALFRPLKLNWHKVVLEWRMENNGVSIDKINFAPVLKRAIDMLDTRKILSSGFRACGLYPFSLNAIDYSKLIKRSSMNVTEEAAETSHIHFIEKNINSNTLQLFKQAQQSGVWTGELCDRNLFYFWLTITSQQNLPINDEGQAFAGDRDLQETLHIEEHVLQPHKHNTLEKLELSNINIDPIVLTINNEVCNAPDTLMPVDNKTVCIVYENGTEEDVSIETDHPVRQECLDTLIGDTDKVYEDKNSTNSPQEEKNNNSQSNRNRNIQRIPSPFERCLFWPERKPENLKKRRKNKIPAVATSEEWRAYHKRLAEQKQKAEEEKENKKNLRLINQKIKKEKAEEEKENKKNLRLLKQKIKKEKAEEKQKQQVLRKRKTKKD